MEIVTVILQGLVWVPAVITASMIVWLGLEWIRRSM